MRITFLGHVGLFLETEKGSVLCDPWFTPAYFGSWFPFPRNDRLDPSAFAEPDYLYVSHLHHDHFDPAFLWAHVDKRTTVLLPDFPTTHLERELRAVGFTEFLHTRDGEPAVTDTGLEVAIVALTAPADGPLGDSALVVSDGETRVLDQNDARPRDFAALDRLGPYDAEFVQFSGAIWWPMVYDLPDDRKVEEGRRKRAAQMERARHYIDAAAPAHVFPAAGPPCFLDDELWVFNDLDGDDANIFPDQTVFLTELERHGSRAHPHLVVPGSVVRMAGSECTITHPDGESSPEAIFADKRAHLERYRADWQPWLTAEKASWPRHKHDVVRVLTDWWEPLLDMAPRTRAGVGAPLLLHVGDTAVLVDFPAGTVREWSGESYGFRFDIDRALVEWCIDHRVEDWVNEVFLSCRFRAHRDGPYNEYLYTFFKCLSVERMAFCEGFYAEVAHEDETWRCGDYVVQLRCPHLRADLSRFGVVKDGGVLHCKVHGWEFDLETGRCLTSDDEVHRLRTRRADA